MSLQQWHPISFYSSQETAHLVYWSFRVSDIQIAMFRSVNDNRDRAASSWPRSSTAQQEEKTAASLLGNFPLMP
jgi:hypothetical protein